MEDYRFDTSTWDLDYKIKLMRKWAETDYDWGYKWIVRHTRRRSAEYAITIEHMFTEKPIGISKITNPY